MKPILPLAIASLIFFSSLLLLLAAPMIQRVSGATRVVQQGDTLYSIAREYGTTVDGLKAANGLSSNVIWIGQVLVVDALGGGGQVTHTVVHGDTLYTLARRYGTSINAIMRANSLTSANIYVGQRLIIVLSATPIAGTTMYTVVLGDTLYAIARRFGTSVDVIRTANNLPTTQIYVGQRLVIVTTVSPMTPIATLPISTLTATPTVNGTPQASPPAGGGTPVVTSMPIATPMLNPLTPTMTPVSNGVIIQSINYDGAVPQSESDEYVVIVNHGTTSQNLNGWRLYADDAGQDFFFPDFELEPAQSCRVYTNQYHPESCGFSYGRGSAIWNNEGDCGTLFNASNAEVSIYCYD